MYVLDVDQFKKARISLTLIFFNILSFVLFNLLLPEHYILSFIQINVLIIEELEWWRLLTPIFFHADITHLFSNMVGLLLFGTVVEENYTKVEYFAIYFISGVIGNIFSLWLLPIYSISLGASGAVFGLMGATVILFLFEEDKSLLLFGFVYIAFFLYASLAPGINIWAHLFGLIGGIGLGYIFTYTTERKYDL
ncbi:MAG: rhomboid family intramembrane serine protease [Promethearchaeia archaeon]